MYAPAIERKAVARLYSHDHTLWGEDPTEISNRLGWVKTKQPDETEQALYAATDARWWPYINLYLVTWGQNVCRPIGPRCGDCVIARDCPRIGVVKPIK